MKILSVTESLVQQLREEIITGQISAGSRLNEIELSERFEVSRPPLREAFRKLEYENLVVSTPRRGVVTTTVSAEDCRQVYFTRKVIESAALELLEKIQLGDFSGLEDAVRKGEEFKLPVDPGPHQIAIYYETMAEFHRRMVAATQNAWLIHCYSSFRSTLARYQIMYLRLPGVRQLSMEGHRQILRLMQAGDYQAARKRLALHLDRVLERLLERFQKNGVFSDQCP